PRFGEPINPSRYRPETPEWLETLLVKACAREPEMRFETADEFLVSLERGANRPLSRPRRLPLIERNPSLALKILAAVSFIMNVVLIFLLSRR
ncbi:MAG TPA: bifunctional protein-serine/threonine kinase/phosphatase, partial [Burkholderiales bacterium]|nr:bifunctional protein-serine/threonine kinase/phosphatase [Burkholderiales bacterium]